MSPTRWLCGKMVFGILNYFVSYWLLDYVSWYISRVLCFCYIRNGFVKFVNACVKWLISKINLKSWNEKSKLERLIYEITKLCFKCLYDRFCWINLLELDYDLILNETCITMRCISYRTCDGYMPKFWIVTSIFILLKEYHMKKQKN